MAMQKKTPDAADTSEPTGTGAEPVEYAQAPSAIGWPEVKRFFQRLGPVGILAAIAASVPAIGGILLLGTMKWSGAWLEGLGETGILLYVFGFSFLAGLALLPTHVQAVLGGWVFGLQYGTVAALCGIGGASLIGYVIARRASGDRVVRLIEEQPKWKAVYDALLGSGPLRTLGIVTLIRIPPNSPFAITNLVMASCRIRPLVYLVGTVVGIAPRTVAAVFIGTSIQGTDFAVPKERWFFIAGLIVTLIVVAVIGVLANQAVARVTASHGHHEADEPQDESVA